jgi:hypothetical protein
MAFPGTYNISYYKGDTLEFKLYPKDSSGAAFDLTDYEDEYGSSPLFTISTARGPEGADSQIEAYAEIVDNTYILCVIRPEDGEELNSGTQYVYDVEISKTGGSYDTVYTLLTGTISVTDQVTGAIAEDS